MTVGSYLFQSPYSSSVQVGRPDSSAKKEDTSQVGVGGLSSATNQTLQDAKNFQVTQISDVKPSVDSTHLLDVYA